MNYKRIYNLYGILFFLLFFLFGVISEFMGDLSDKMTSIVFSFICMLLAVLFLILGNQENE